MAEQRDAALLLRSIPYSDSSLIIHVLTENHGRISLMARGARRAKSPLRASLMPLHQLYLRWKEPRTGTMGTLLEAQRNQSLIPESHMLAGQELLSKASNLFPDGVDYGYEALFSSFLVLSDRPEQSGLPAAIWHILEHSGWVGDFEHCWHCTEYISLNLDMYWNNNHLLCTSCSREQGLILSSGCRKSLHTSLHQKNVQLSQDYINTWHHMIKNIMTIHTS
ncbi:MAG: DNA repair protein RecO [Ghiorsea sp.]